MASLRKNVLSSNFQVAVVSGEVATTGSGSGRHCHQDIIFQLEITFKAELKWTVYRTLKELQYFCLCIFEHTSQFICKLPVILSMSHQINLHNLNMDITSWMNELCANPTPYLFQLTKFLGVPQNGKVEPRDHGVITRIAKSYGMRCGYLSVKIHYAPLAIKRGISDWKKRYVVLADSIYIFKNESACRSDVAPEDVIPLDMFFVSKQVADVGLEDGPGAVPAATNLKIHEFSVHTELCVLSCQSAVTNDEANLKNWLAVLDKAKEFC